MIIFRYMSCPCNIQRFSALDASQTFLIAKKEKEKWVQNTYYFEPTY